MKKIIAFFAVILCAASCLFAQEIEYDSLMQKAKDYENQKKYVYAMGTYWDAILSTDDYEKQSEAYTGYHNLEVAFLSGMPGLDEYDDFSFYDEWQRAYDEWIMYKAEYPMFYISFGKLEKGLLDYETRTATYSIEAELKYSEKSSKIKKSLDEGYEKAKKSNWKEIDFESKIKELAKKNKPMFFYQDYSDSNHKNYGNPYETYIRIKTGTSAYTDLELVNSKGVLKVQEVSKTKDDYDFIACTTLDFNILDTNGNILFKCDNIAIDTNKYSSKFVKKIEKVPQNVMKVIDAGEYSIEPVTLTYISGYLSTNPTDAEIKKLQRKKIAVPTIETIKDINLNNFYKKYYNNIKVTAEENYKKYSNGKYSKEFLLDSLMFPLTETKYEFLATNEYYKLSKLQYEGDGLKGGPFIFSGVVEYWMKFLFGYDPSVYYRNYSPQKRIIFKTRERMYDIRNEVEKINDKELRIEKLMQSLPQTNLDIMITPVYYKVFGLSSSDSKEKICNSLSETTGLEIVYKQNPDNTFEKNINANGYRIAEIDELKKAKDSGLIEWNEESMELYVVRKHNEQKLNSIPELEERIQKAEEEEKKRLEAEEEEKKRLEAEEDRKNGILRIPEGTKVITSTKLKVFWNYDSIEEINYIVIPDSVTVIEHDAFSGCTSLKEITIPDSVTEIGYDAFSGCTSLKEITIPNSVTYISDSAFEGCTSLKEIRIPKEFKDKFKDEFRFMNFIKENKKIIKYY